MKITHYVKIGLVLGVAAIPFSAFALSVNLNGSVQATASSSSSSSSKAKASSTILMETGLVTTTSSPPARTSTGLILDVNTDGIAIEHSSQVASEEDLKVFSRNEAKEDKSVYEIKTDSADKLEVKYVHKGKFLGIYPVYVTSTTYVDSTSKNGTKVWTKMPWWNIFVTGTHDISSHVDDSLKESTTVSAAAQADASAYTRAQAVEAIIAAHAHAAIVASTTPGTKIK